MAKQPYTILIVEDDIALNEAYQMLLEQAGYSVQVAFNGKEALERTDKTSFDLIFLDLRMPVMDGIAFLEQYKPGSDKKHSAKVIVFSNYDMQKEVDRAYELGAERYVLKAWTSPKELLHLVQNISRGAAASA